ncbi:hypothetical protein X975_13527, partial [Stegodyphus mimosarum]
MVEAFLNIGRGHSAMEQFSMSIGMKTMDRKTFDKCVVQLVKESKSIKEKVFELSRKAVREQHEILYPSKIGEDIIDIGVSFDGTWHKRGHNSLYCIGCVIDILTGLVIDFVIISKYCHHCKITAHDLGVDSAEYAVWFDSHKTSSMCEKNYDRSSTSMEVYAAEILWKRSIEKCRMRYTVILSDGDAKSFIHLSNLKIYGDIQIVKEECLNHVAKRLGTGLRNKVKEWKIKGECLGGKKKGNLTEQTITKLTNYYRKAIRDNVPDVAKMKTAIFASLYHCCSTNTNPQHKKCPSGSESWCFYNRALAKGTQIPNHCTMKTFLSEKVVSKILPVYQRLANDEILKRCSNGKTQNSNESLHNLIWHHCPKEVFVSKRRLELAALSGISQFNMGNVAFEHVKNPSITNSPALCIAKKRDGRRLKQSTLRNTVTYKTALVKKRFNKSKMEKKQLKNEGITYSAGAF